MTDVHEQLPLTTTAVSLLEEYKEAPKVRVQYEISDQENIDAPYSLSDPIGDEPHTFTKGLVHRYSNRVLLKISDQCAAYCRFCFRKDMLNKGESVLSPDDLNHALTYIQNHQEIEEVILSGGDPLILSNRRLAAVLDQITTIPHLTRIRFHTRMPLIKPTRIDYELLTMIEKLRQDVRIVIHINHADELTSSRITAIKALNETGAGLLSQSVLLKGVNDNAVELNHLFETLDDLNVRPYYLHHLDKAYGTHHFRVSIDKGQGLMKEIVSMRPRYKIPDYMIDIPGGFGKRSLLQAENVKKIDQNQYLLTDTKNNNHVYIDEAV